MEWPDRNSGLKAIARNAGEAIGVFGTLDWTERNGFSLPSLITGQGFSGKHISFDSSVNVMNLRRIEARLWNCNLRSGLKTFLASLTRAASRTAGRCTTNIA